MPHPLAPRDARDRMIVALDFPSPDRARRLVETLDERASFYKIGMQLVFAGGLELIPELSRAGKRVFLDMKLFDIDNAVAGGVESIARLDAVTLTTVHAYPKALRAAVAARTGITPGLLAVTVITSMDDADVRAAGSSVSAAALVKSRAEDARAAGMDGIVCSPHEVVVVRRAVGADMLIVVPGVRPQGAAINDQRRVMTPGETIAAGADYLVIGRPVTTAADPAAVAEAVVEEIETALAGRGEWPRDTGSYAST